MKWSKVTDTHGGCHTCHGEYVMHWTSGNAVGLAAQHAKANPTHRVWALQERTWQWRPDGAR